MKASVLREFGLPSVLKYEEVATPTPRPGYLLIKVLAAGINRLETYLRQGVITRDLALPHVLGSDASGEVAALGKGVHGFTVGERVVPMPGYPLSDEDASFSPMSSSKSYAIGGIANWGTYAEYIEVPARWTLKDKTTLKPAEIATLPMVIVTGVRAVKVAGNVKAGDTVLIHGGASATGSFSIQLAKALGAKVATTASSDEKIDLASRLGADLVVDIRQKDFVKEITDWTSGKGVDIAIDNLGGNVLQRSIEATRVGGTIVTLGFVAGSEATLKVRDFFFAQKTLRGTLMGDMNDLAMGLDLIVNNKIKPVLDRALPLDQAHEAHALLESGSVLGNVVLIPSH
jgi:NADPH:quinone reductase